MALDGGILHPDIRQYKTFATHVIWLLHCYTVHAYCRGGRGPRVLYGLSVGPWEAVTVTTFTGNDSNYYQNSINREFIRQENATSLWYQYQLEDHFPYSLDQWQKSQEYIDLEPLVMVIVRSYPSFHVLLLEVWMKFLEQDLFEFFCKLNCVMEYRPIKWVVNPAILLRRRLEGMTATSSQIFLFVWKSRVRRG